MQIKKLHQPEDIHNELDVMAACEENEINFLGLSVTHPESNIQGHICELPEWGTYNYLNNRVRVAWADRFTKSGVRRTWFKLDRL